MTAYGVSSCPRGTMRYFPDLVREAFDVPPDIRILLGISFGYEDPAVAANKTPGRPRESGSDGAVPALIGFQAVEKRYAVGPEYCTEICPCAASSIPASAAPGSAA